MDDTYRVAENYYYDYSRSRSAAYTQHHYSYDEGESPGYGEPDYHTGAHAWTGQSYYDHNYKTRQEREDRRRGERVRGWERGWDSSTRW